MNEGFNTPLRSAWVSVTIHYKDGDKCRYRMTVDVSGRLLKAWDDFSRHVITSPIVIFGAGAEKVEVLQDDYWKRGYVALSLNFIEAIDVVKFD
jgi:hypothetical protein